MCINDKTFKRDDVILWANNGKNNAIKEEFWAEEITTFFGGKSHSLQNIASQIGNDFAMHYKLKFGQNYSIFIHDPSYYVFTTNPETMPYILLNMYDSNSQSVSIKAIYQKKMDKTNQGYEPSESYSFTACIKTI